MNYRICFYLIVLSIVSVRIPIVAHDVIDHAAISAQAQSMKDVQIKKQKVYGTAVKVGGAALCGYLLYYGYTVYAYNNVTVPLTVPAEIAEELKKPSIVAELIKKGAEKIAQEENSWMNSISASAVKFTGSLVLQSMVFQALQPVYKSIQNYFSSKVSVPVTRTWFLAEQFTGDEEAAQNKKIEISQEFFECIMHIESVEFAYIHHDADLIKDSAQMILAHILFVKEYETRYLYQKHTLQNCYNALVATMQHMADDARNALCDQQRIETFKNHIRELRKHPAYSII
jgi:hypothetical protein